MSLTTVLFKPMRLRILKELTTPDTAAGVARRIGVARQKINYHLRELEREGLVELVEERRKRNCIERVFRTTSPSYVACAVAVADLASRVPGAPADQRSAALLLAVVVRTLANVATPREHTQQASSDLSTFAVENSIQFASVVSSTEFFADLDRALSQLIAKYDDKGVSGGMRFRVVVGAHLTDGG